MVPDGRTDRSVDLVIGQTFTQLVPQPPKPPTPASGVKLNVYNTTFRTGLAAKTAKSLAARGFRIQKTGNDPHPKILSVSGLIVYGDDGENAARRVALQLAGAKMVNDHRSGTDRGPDPRQRLHRTWCRSARPPHRPCPPRRHRPLAGSAEPAQGLNVLSVAVPRAG